jgi:hypothetical protein
MKNVACFHEIKYYCNCENQGKLLREACSGFLIAVMTIKAVRKAACDPKNFSEGLP